MHLSLQTTRLTLRPIEPGDAALLFDLDSDPEVMRHLSGGRATPLAEIETSILPRFLSYADRAPWAGVWIASTRSTGEFAGWFSLRPPEDLSLGPDLGYRLKRMFWGSGLATEGAAALIDRAFQHPEVQRAFGSTYELNVASRRVLEKLGMRHVRSYRLEEEGAPPPATFAAGGEAWEGDEVEYAITRQEWEARR